MNTLISTVGRSLGGGAFLYIVLEVIIFLIGVWILYAVIKSAVKNALIEAKGELGFTMQKPPAAPEAERSTGAKDAPEYMSGPGEPSAGEAENREKRAEKDTAEW